jgi:hypothetical protein
LEQAVVVAEQELLAELVAMVSLAVVALILVALVEQG